MNSPRKASATQARGAHPAKDHGKDYYRAEPRGEIDYDALAKDVKHRFPKILARLAE
jgi:hypothetical protein